MNVIQVEALNYAYTGSKPVLKDINFEIKEGETIGMVGLSGCGKTTLCHCLSGIIPHVLGGSMDGRVIVNGKETKSVKLANLACEIGMVFQDTNIQLIATTVEDEIAFAPEEPLPTPGADTNHSR